MYEIFNMGHRLKCISPELAKEIIIISEKYNVKAQIIGYVETADNTEIVIESDKIFMSIAKHFMFLYNIMLKFYIYSDFSLTHIQYFLHIEPIHYQI